MAENVLDTQTAAALLKVSPRRLQQLASDGWIKPAGRNRWPLVATVQGYFSFLKSGQEDDAAGQPKAAVQEARAEEIRRRIAREDRETIDVAEAVDTLDQVNRVYLQSISSLARRITSDRRERARISSICATEAARLSEHLDALRSALETGALDPDPDDET